MTKATTTKKSTKETVEDTVTDLSVVSDDGDVTEAVPVFKMPDLMEAIDGLSEIKRSELREAAGLVLSAISGALEKGQNVNLPGFGKIIAKRREEKENGDVIIARIKLAASQSTADEPEVESV